MGRNIIILNTRDELGVGPLESIDAIEIEPLGSQQYVIDKIKEAFPEIHASDPLWIILAREDYSLTFNFYGKDIVEALSIGIHGIEDAVNEVERLCLLTGWRAIDPNTGVIY